MSHFIYADHAATTAVSDTALQAMLPHFTTAYGNPSSLYRFAQEGKTDLERARAEISACLNARPEEIYFTSGGTEADNWALRGVAELMALKGRKGGHIITSAIEHHAVLHTAQYLEKQGYEVTYLPVDGRGLVDPAALEGAIRPDTILISIMAANNEIGTIEPVAELGRIARAHKVLFHTDAVQAVGHIPVDVEAWNVDLLSLSAHKFRGPKGVGALYVKKPLRLPALIQGGGQEKGRRSGTENVPGAVGMAAALREAGCTVTADSGGIRALCRERLRAVGPVQTAPYPGFPTDAQAVLMAALLRSRGATVFEENIFENRYRHVDELIRMGASIRVSGRVAVVTGVERLHSAPVRCTDLRGGAALCVAALAAEGETRVSQICHIDRGYEDLARDLRALGADAVRVEETENG